MVRTPYYFRAMIVLVAMAVALVVAGGVALGAQQEEPPESTTTQQDSSSTSSSDVQPSVIIEPSIAAWGSNVIGQLGNGTTGGSSNTPVPVSNLSDVTDIDSGHVHSLAIKNDGTVWAWGSNEFGKLGNGTTGGSSNTPVQVKDPSDPTNTGFLQNVTAIAGGGSHSLALKSDGTVWAWGNNRYGQLGDGTTTDSNTPIQVGDTSGSGPLTDVTAITGGHSYSLALKSDGTVVGWGSNSDGQLGTGTFGPFTNTRPVQVKDPSGSGPLTDIKAIAGSNYHSLALKRDGTVWAWGYNGDGELGNGTNTSSNTPVKVSSLSGVTDIDVGEYHSLALKNVTYTYTIKKKRKNGRIIRRTIRYVVPVATAWGYNEYGQLGNGTTTDSNVPVQVSGLSGVTNIEGGGDHSLAQKSDGTVSAWGSNSEGQLGNGTTGGSSNTPVSVSNLRDATDVAAGSRHNLAK